MRIDYSEPKTSCSVPKAGQSRPRKESSSAVLFAVLITGIICLGVGFGSGWMLSQRSAKKAFKAAMEQQSLENNPQPVKAQPPPVQQPPATPQPQVDNTSAQPPSAVASPPAIDPPLSFYKTLPGGQKSNTMGSGINTKEEKPARLPLQAAMPTNVTKPAQSQPDETTLIQPVKVTPAKPATAVHPETSGHTVQVASFSLKSEAEALRSKLTAKGYNVGIVESHLGDKGTWYRVRVGKHLDPEAAKELAAKLGKGAIAIPEKD
ncbi:MAG: SPOR domain-containing protein [Desulfuromonadaceae bacterium]